MRKKNILCFEVLGDVPVASNIIKNMSLDQIRRLKLLRDLQKSPKVAAKSESKQRMLSTISMTDNVRRLNKNKKYMLEEQRNTQIERNNRLLYQKIMGHFQSLKETTQHRNKWRKRKRKVRLVSNGQESQFDLKRQKTDIQPIKFRSRVNTIRESRVQQPQTLFMGMGEIDNMLLKIKLTLSKERYLLLAKNGDLSIELQMDYKQYMRLHNSILQGNPCNIFKLLVIDGGKIHFRGRRQREQKPESLKVSKTKTIL